MGYTSKLELVNFGVKTSKTKEEIEEFLRKCDEFIQNSIGFRENDNIQLELLNDGRLLITAKDYWIKWKNTDNIAWIIKEIIDVGLITLDFVGEDGERWGYIIKDKTLIGVEYIANEFIIKDESLPIAKKIKEVLDENNIN